MMDQGEQTEPIYRILQEISAKLYTLPTREELALYVTKEVFNIKIDSMTSELEELKNGPSVQQAKQAFVIDIVLAAISVFSFLLQHWK